MRSVPVFHSLRRASALALLASAPGCADLAQLPEAPSSLAADPALQTAPSHRFVYTQGRLLMLNGRPYRHVGVNTHGLLYHSLDQMRTDLDGMRDAGVRHVRVFLPNSKLGAAATGDRLQRLLEEAYPRGIRVTVALTDFTIRPHYGAEGQGGYYHVPGDLPFYSHQAGSYLVLNRAWFQGGYRFNYLPFAREIVRRFNTHPGIFAWELGNEIRDPYGDPGVTTAFVRAVSDSIRAWDPNHLIATGFISSRWAGLATDAQKDAVYRHPNIDYITVHIYDQSNQDGGYDDFALSTRIGKPIVVEETGVSKSRFPDFFTRVASSFADFYNVRGAAAVMVWGVQFGEYDHGSGDHEYGPREQGRLADYRALWRGWSIDLDRRNGGNQAQFVSQSVPTAMVAGGRYTVSITMRNTGNTPWIPHIGYALGAQNPHDNSTWGVGRAYLPRRVVQPTKEVTFTFEVTAPSTPGSYDFQWRMLREMVDWFGDYTPNVSVQVGSGQLPARVKAAFRTHGGHYLVAESGGGREVLANRTSIGPWEEFWINDLNGGALESGDRVTLQTQDGRFYLVAEGGGGPGSVVYANRTTAGAWERFVIRRVDGSGTIRSGDRISLRAYNPYFVVAENGGGGAVHANRTSVGAWESFTLIHR